LKEDFTYRDRLLFKRISQGDAQAFTEFFEAYSVKLAIYVSRFLYSDAWAEEIVQDVFLKLWSTRETIGDIEYPAAFVYRMTANRAKDLLRHREKEIRLQQYLIRHFDHPVANDTQDQFDFRIGEQLLRQAIERLPKQRAVVFKMRHEQGLGYDEIAEQLGISRHTVRNLLNLAMQNIRTWLLEEGGISFILAAFIYFSTFF
jgi:RNA polymerase sigma-70 factor (ECF subfamily)